MGGRGHGTCQIAPNSKIDWMKPREVTVTWYTDLESADRDRADEYRRLTPDQRVEEVFRLMEMFAGWERHGRLDRTARFNDVP